MMIAGGIIGSTGIKHQYMGSRSSTSNSSTYTFNGVPIGDGAPDRIIVIGVINTDSGNMFSSSSLTVDGVPAQKIGSFLGSSPTHMAWFAIEKPTGTEADVIVTFGLSGTNCVIFIWSVRKVASLLPFAEDAGAGPTNAAWVRVNIPARGLALFMGGHANSNPATWSDATEVDAATVENRYYSAAELISRTELVDHEETRSWSGSVETGLSAVVFEPRSGRYPALYQQVARATSVNNDSSTWNADLPPGIEAGELLVVVATVRAGSARTISTPTGWTRLYGVTGGGNLRQQAAFYRIANGSEGSVLALAASGSSRWATASFRIGKHSGQIEANTATGSSSNADPPSLSPSWGSAPTLWLAIVSDIANNSDPPGWPLGWSLPLRALNIYLGDVGVRHTSAVRRETASSVDPGAFTLPTSGQWIAATIAIH